MGVHDCGTDELKAPLSKIRAQSPRFLCFWRNLFDRLPFIVNRLAPHKMPNIFVKAAEFLLDLEKEFCVVDSRPDLQFIANDPLISEKRGDFCLVVPGYFFGIEV